MTFIFEQLDISLLLLLLGLAFLASFVDSVVGGGGLILLPALLFVGLPPSSALATNKLVGSMGSLTSTIMFYRSGKVSLKSVSKLVPLSFFGSLLGVYIVHLINPIMLKPIMLVMLALVFIYSLIKKDFGQIGRNHTVSIIRTLIFVMAVFCIGFYDGFLGPGTGSFLIFVFLLLGFDFIHAAGHAKVLNFASNIAALLLFSILGEVNYIYGIPMGIAGILGSIAGSKFAINKGVSYIRWLFIIVTFALLVKNAIDLIL